MNYLPPQERLYLQYLGFINTLRLFNYSPIGIKLFNFKKHKMSFEVFQGFELNMHLPLGKRVERFFEFYIEQGSQYSILKKNIQINHNKQTIGEFDFFLEERSSKKVIHVELVYKFYVYKEHLSKIDDEIACYFGPNNHDALADKLQKLKEKQFPLLQNIYAKEQLKDLNTEEVEQQLCFLGNVFSPKTLKPKFELINQECLEGTYMSFEEFLKLDNKNSTFYVPQKQDWLIEPKYCKTWKSYDETLEEMGVVFQKNISLLLWVKDREVFFRMFVIRDEI